MRRRRNLLIAVLSLLALALSACGSSDDDADSSLPATDTLFEEVTADDAGTPRDANRVDATAGQAELSMSEDTVPASDAPADESDGGVAVPIVSPIDTGRDIISTAAVTIEATDVIAASNQAVTAMSGLGGIVSGQQTEGNPRPTSVITFRVAPADFQEALTRLGEIGDVRHQSISTEDVTERVVDLESRIITAEASVARLRDFLSGATDLETIANLEGQLLQRETDLELLRGQLRTVQNQVALSTISLTIIEALPPTPIAAVTVMTSAYLGHDEGTGCGTRTNIDIDEGADMTVCYTVTNVGDTALTALAVRDEALGVDADDIMLVSGSADALAPNETSKFVYETEASTDKATARGDVSAIPVDGDGEPLSINIERQLTPVDLNVAEDTSLPGFFDGLSGGFAVMLSILSVLTLVLAAMIPFVWLIPVGWFAFRWYTNRRHEDPTAEPAQA